MRFEPVALTFTRCAAQRRKCGRLMVAALLASGALGAASPTLAWVVDQKSTVNIAGASQYASTFGILDLPIMNIAPSISVNLGLVQGGAAGHANIDARLFVGSSSAFDIASKASARTFIFSAVPDPTVGQSFFLINQIDSLGIQKLNINTSSFSAYAGLNTDLGGSAWGSACLGFCVDASLKVKVKGPLPLVSVDASGLSVFDSLVDASLPYEYSALGGLAKASASIPTFAKTLTNVAPGAAAVMAPKQESVLTASLDVAGLVAKAFGFPIPLKGDLLGFGYELLSLDAFVGMNLEHAFKFTPSSPNTTYSFSSPVQYFDKAIGDWSIPITMLTMNDNEAAELRSTAATSIGIQSYQTMNYKVDYDFDLLLSAGVDLSALELHGLGLSLGPLLDPDPWKNGLGSFDIDSGVKIGKLGTVGGTTNISFKPYTLTPASDGTPVLVDICASLPGGCDPTGYVTESVNIGDFIQSTTYRVFNLGYGLCDPTHLLECIVDPHFVPVVTQVRRGESVTRTDRDAELLAMLREFGFFRGDAGVLSDIDFFEYADDFGLLGAFLEAAPLLENPASSATAMLDALRALGIDPANPFPARVPLTGAPPLQEGDLTQNRSASLALELSVPEPSGLSLVAIAGLMLALTMRYRRVPAVRTFWRGAGRRTGREAHGREQRSG